MATKRAPNTHGNQEVSEQPRSAILAAQGVQTGEEFAGMMSALMSDVIDGRVTPSVANAACNAGGKLLKVVEMSYKYGSNDKKNRRPSLLLTS